MKTLIRKRIVLLIAVLWVGAFPVEASHIVGGEMYYDYLGNNDYRITLKIYRDLTGNADFDLPGAEVTVYSGNNPNPYIPSLVVPLISRQLLPKDLNNPCLEPPANINVELGIFETVINLPTNVAGYTITYQRCCRNGTISNIFNPGDVGSTYFVTITGGAQQSNNSSPRFTEFPPIVICDDQPLVFDHSATDPNGNTLVYSLCTPVEGGGPDIQNFTQPFGANPQPDLPPPYNPVNFIPPFATGYPLPAAPALSIDPVTGLLTGTPTAQGQYVVGVCVEEYDAQGNLLSTIRRDFQFNVVNCIVTVFADLAADVQLTQDSFLIQSCGDSTVTFINQSGQPQNITNVRWEIYDSGASLFNSTLFNPTYTFPDTGTYNGLLIANPGSAGCTDTAYFTVLVYPDLTADFSFAYDTCVIGPVQFTDQSFSLGGPLVAWTWDFDDGRDTSIQNPSHQYYLAGNFDVSLTIEDINGCTETLTQPLSWFPAPEINVNAGSGLGCAPLSLTLNNLSYPVNGYSFLWNLGDGTTSTDFEPVHIYDAGIYNLALTITSPIGCVSYDSFPSLVTVNSSPSADFFYSPSELSNFNPTVQFIDQSLFANQWQWDFGNGDGSFFPSPQYTYADTGIYTATLVVTHPSGCQDTAVQLINIAPRFTYFLPNAFSPNGDGVNDGYRGAGLFYGIEDFELQIFNRWGECIFTTDDPNETWNGRKNNIGAMSPAGVYVCQVLITGERGKRFEFTSYATLVH